MQVDDAVTAVENNGYQNIVAVDRDKLHGLGVNKTKCEQFAAGQNTAQLNLIEFFHALPYYPIAFIRQQDNDYTACAVLGLDRGENLFTDEHGCWQDDAYVPAYIRRYPFITEAVSRDELESGDPDLRKPVFVDEVALSRDAPSLFIANGVATSEWQTIESFVSDYISAEKLTLSFTKKLVALNLLEAFDAQIHPDKGDMMRLQGLFRVNEDRLNKLPAKTIRELMQSGELSRIYAHLISLENFAKLLDRKAANNQK